MIIKKEARKLAGNSGGKIKVKDTKRKRVYQNRPLSKWKPSQQWLVLERGQIWM